MPEDFIFGIVEGVSFDGPGGPTPAPGRVIVSFGGPERRRAVLDPEHPLTPAYERRLRRWAGERWPTYVDFAQPRFGGAGVQPALLINRVTQPIATYVDRVSRSGEDNSIFDVSLSDSAAVHMVAPSTARARDLLERLEAVAKSRELVLLSRDEMNMEVLDVRSLEEAGVPLALIDKRLVQRDGTGPTAILVATSAVDESVARDIYARLATSLCTLPGMEPGGCLPFQYKDDFCWSTAHAVCQMIASRPDGNGGHLTPAKLWVRNLDAKLTFRTPFATANCRARWTFHVAAVLASSAVPGKLFVFDPIVFDPQNVGSQPQRPVPDERAWRGQFGGDSPDVETDVTEPSVYRNTFFTVQGDRPIGNGEPEDLLQMARERFRDAILKYGQPPFPCP